MAKIKRSELATYINTTALGATPETWSLAGVGIVSGEIAYNPNIESITFIHEDNASGVLSGYAPAMPIEAMAYNTNEVYEFIDSLRKSRALLAAANTQIVNVYLYDTPIDGIYPAEYQPVTISIESFGGDGGAAARLNYTINYQGDPVIGWFDVAAGTFTAAPVLAVLDTMVIGSVTLTPLFATDPTFLWYSGAVSNATDTVSMTSTCTASGAVVVQEDESGVVSQGGDASLAVGANVLTIEVTVGDEVVTYTITITREAA